MEKIYTGNVRRIYEYCLMHNIKIKVTWRFIKPSTLIVLEPQRYNLVDLNIIALNDDVKY